MAALERIQSIENNLQLGGSYEYELEALKGIEQDIAVYRYLGTPIWKIEEAKKEIARIREWIGEELATRAQ